MKTYKNNLHKLNFGILNVRGCKTTFEKQILAEDAANYDIDILGISETHIKQEDFEEITVYKNNKKVEYQLFYTGNNSNHGVGLLLKKDLKAKVKTVSERICVANFAFGGRNCTVISAYAHTLAVSESKPELRETFYQQLDKTLKNIPKRNVCVVVGDFNAKTGSGHELYPSENLEKVSLIVVELSFSNIWQNMKWLLLTHYFNIKCVIVLLGQHLTATLSRMTVHQEKTQFVIKLITSSQNVNIRYL